MHSEIVFLLSPNNNVSLRFCFAPFQLQLILSPLIYLRYISPLIYYSCLCTSLRTSYSISQRCFYFCRLLQYTDSFSSLQHFFLHAGAQSFAYLHSLPLVPNRLHLLIPFLQFIPLLAASCPYHVSFGFLMEKFLCCHLFSLQLTGPMFCKHLRSTSFAIPLRA